MGSETLQLPIIDFSNLNHQTQTWESVRAQVKEALEKYGCYEATFDHIPLHLQNSVLDGLNQLFDLPLENKLLNVSERPYHGYVHSPFLPLYESLGIEDALSPERIDNFTNLMWPQGNLSFSKNMKAYAEKLSEMDKVVRKMVLESLGLEKYKDEHINSTNYVVRVQKYDRPKSSETEPGLIAHTDKNIITILQQLNPVKGLEILTKDGKNWITAEPTSPHSFFVFAGTSFHAWTNGRLHSPLHRVMMKGDEARYTIGLFSIPKPGTVIKAPEEMEDEEHPLIYKAFDYHKFIDFFYSSAGITSPDALKDYCGV